MDTKDLLKIQIESYQKASLALSDAHDNISKAEGSEKHRNIIRCRCHIGVAYNDIHNKITHLKNVLASKENKSFLESNL